VRVGQAWRVRRCERSGAPEAAGESSTDAPATGRDTETLAQLLGGRAGAVDATLPPLAFVVAWLLLDRSIPLGALAALVAGALVAGFRLFRGDRPRAVLLGLLAVVVAAVVALYTGRAADFFLVQLLSNAGSALAWAVSIVLRWPLLGVVVGAVIGQRTRWRRDPDLLRGYGLASWVWVGQYVLRVAVFGVLWWSNAVVALGVARIVLSWPLVAACLTASWWVLRRALPPDHPGLRHPRTS
jgi:hypothetical protein